MNDPAPPQPMTLDTAPGRIVVIVQARMGSSRLPGKVMQKIDGIPMIDLLLDRLGQAKRIDAVVLATTDQPADTPLAAHVAARGVMVVRGSETDVLGRYCLAAAQSRADTVIRITGDCPLVDPALIDRMVDRYSRGTAPYLSNIEPPTFPDGLDVEIFSAAALEHAGRHACEQPQREHVTPFLRSGPFRTENVTWDEDLSDLRVTVDEPDDLELIRAIFAHFAPRRDFGWQEVVDLLRTDSGLAAINTGIARNEGGRMSNGQKLWKRAKKVIPGGNMLLSKRAEMFLPDQWPAYFSRTRGCRVWDLDDREFLDMGMMGIGTNTLGYSHPEVDDAVRAVIDAGNLSTLNAPEEVALAERLVDMHPFAEMARFARSGGEANAIAIRIARAASGRDGVAVCGYHGWHDWYLSANLGTGDSLAGHLLPGLDPAGVPKAMRGLVQPFNYNDLDALRAIVSGGEIGVIKMEVRRNDEPAPGFLEGVRALADENGIALVFDECTSGFRETFGGLHRKYGVEPDLAVFGKTLGNGYAVTSVIGRRSIMEAAQSTFISSTFWTERIGSAAALKTLEVMERERSWDRITEIGLDYRKRLQDLAGAHRVPVAFGGLPSLTTYSIGEGDALAFKTLITQELLKREILAGTQFYASLAHGPDELDRFFDAMDEILALVRRCLDGSEQVASLLDGPVCHAGFRRLN